MKPALFIMAFLLILGCDDSKNKKENSKETNKNDEKVVERKETKSEPAFYIAFREDEHGPIYITDSDEDIDKLIVDLRPLDVEVELLERDYWKDQRCRRMSARKCAQGDCVVGSCNLVRVGDWNVCRCQ